MIGVVDYDLQISNSIKLTPPNLEIMKIATYYKVEQNQFCRLIDLKEKDLTGYEKVYFFSEQENMPSVPPNFLRAENVIYGGTAFTNGIYVPFKDEIIDFTIPRLTIYKDFFKQKYNEGIKSNIINQFLDDSYYRMYAQDKKLPIPPIKERKRVYLYDYNIFEKDWRNIVKEIGLHKPASIVPIHPIICNNLDDYFFARKQTKINRSSYIILDLDIKTSDLHYLFKNYRHLLIEDITPASNICLSLGGSFDFNFQYYYDFIYKLSILFSFWNQKIPLKLYYSKSKYFKKDPLENLSNAIIKWINYNGKKQYTLNEFFKVIRPENLRKTIEQEKQLFLKWKSEYHSIFEHTQEEIKNGSWKL